MDANTAQTDVTTPSTVDVSQGFPVHSSQPQQASALQQPQQPAEPVNSQTPAQMAPVETKPVQDVTATTPEESRAAMERLKLQNARHAKLLSAIGLDPLSDLGEQLESGLITPEMITRHIAGRIAPQAAQPDTQARQIPTDPVSQAQQAYLAAKEACRQEGQQAGTVSFETMNQYNDALLALQEAKEEQVTRQVTESQQARQVTESVDRVLTVARNGEFHKALPESVQPISEQVHVALTGQLAYAKAMEMGMDPNMLNTQQWEYFANQASMQLGQLAQQLIDYGRRSVQNPIRQPNQSNPMSGFVPAGAGGSPITPQNPYGRANHTNHADMARQYVQRTVPII